jgi:hypothetical protein
MAALEGISSAPWRPRGGPRRPTPRAPAALAPWLLAALLALGLPGRAGAAAEPPARTAPETPARTAESAPELESLLAQFAAMSGFSARFREEKHLAMLQEPLVSRGVVHFATPRRLVRHVEEPLASTFLVQGSEIAFSSADDSGRLDLEASPVLRSLVDGIRLVLAGDVAALRESFRIRLEGDPEASPSDAPGRPWRIRLEPLHAPERDWIASISFAGRGRTPSELRVVERSGDRTVTLFSEVRTDRRFSEDELAKLFRVPPR